MRTVTRNLLLGLLVVVGLLLALGAVPGYLSAGDPYYLTATPVGANDSAAPLSDDGTAVNASALPANRFPFATAALTDAGSNRTGRSEPYWKGPLGIKEAFTHSPFDELAAIRQRTAAVADGGVYVRQNATVYRLAVAQRL